MSITERDIEEVADSSSILARGKAYFRSGRVLSLALKKDTLLAQVRGSSLYHVRIKVADGEIDADCSCPYSYGCKHIVAVLYKWLKQISSKTTILSVQNKQQGMSPFQQLTFAECIFMAETRTLVKAFDIINSQNVRILVKNKKEVIAEVPVNDDKYKVILSIDNFFRDNPSMIKRCSCNNNYFDEACAHKIAVLLTLLKQRDPKAIPSGYEEKIRQELQRENFETLSSHLRNIHPLKEIRDRNYSLFFSIRPSNKGISLSIEKRAILKNGKFGIPSIVNLSFIKKNYNFFSETEKRICNLLFSNLNEAFYYQRGRATKEKFETLIDLEVLSSLKKLYFEQPEKILNCSLPNQKAMIEFSFSNSPDHKKSNKKAYLFRASARIGEEKIDLQNPRCSIIGEEALWLYTPIEDKNNKNLQGRLIEIETRDTNIIRKLIELSNIELSSEMVQKLIESHYITLSDIGNISMPKEYKVQEINTFTPKPRLFLKDHEKFFSIDLRFLYGTKEVVWNNHYDVLDKDKDGNLMKIKRNREIEQKYLSILLEKAQQDQERFMPSIEPWLWLCETSSELIGKGYEIYGQDSLVNCKVSREVPKLRLEVSSGIDWFDLEADVTFGKENVPLEFLLEALKRNESFVKLSDGTLGTIPKKWLNKLGGVIGFLELDKKKGKIKASNAQIGIVESLLDIADKAKYDSQYQELREKFKKFKEIKNMPLPRNLKGTLRPYQKAGYDWLHFLKEFSFGGCLADDMGLGKTIQVLSLLQYEQEQGNKKPSLVVVPTSLVFNWINEINKFAPSLKAYMHHSQERLKNKQEILKQNTDIILTTYGTLIKDASILKEIKFHYVILDESQKIKNPLSKSKKHASDLKGDYRLVLTGTPVENNYLELWSQFSFINPGLLGNMDYFKETFMRAMEKNKQEEQASALKNIINPFILMRKKETVAKELPEKQITLLYTEMGNDQREFYDIWKEKCKREIQSSLEERGLIKSRFKILQGILRLRQICNHPKLIDESFPGESTKCSLLIRHIEEIIAEGHKILVFSSFVKMLQIIKNELVKRGISFSYLDGSTRDREKVVNDFQQNPSIPVFLISLKAGGLGLNLTAADYVFIVDPWWNPAAEMQAMDRSHRIGQDKNVFVYKMITKDSIEEKILQLQETKMDLVKKVIISDESIFKNLSHEDINKLFT